MEMAGQVVVVTGGGNGIGAACAERFAAAGALVVVADVDATAAARVAEPLEGVAVACDVQDDAAVADLAVAAQALGPVALVMANAGVALGGRWECVPLAEWQRLFDVNVQGVVRTVHAFLPGMLERGAGRLVITGSSAGLFSSDNGMNGPYMASKYALTGMARALAAYARPHGIGVHLLAPAMTDTAFPRSSVAWGRRGSRITTDAPVPADADTADDVADALMAGLAEDRFLISLMPDTQARLHAFADTLEP